LVKRGGKQFRRSLSGETTSGHVSEIPSAAPKVGDRAQRRCR
jgi:hypothetical protein